MVGMIRFACGTCGEKLSVPAKFAGRKGVCPGCRAINRVPQADDAAVNAVAAATLGNIGRAASAASHHAAGMTAGASSSTAAVAERPGTGHGYGQGASGAAHEPPAVRVTVRETVWRSIDPPTVDRPPAPAALPAPPAARATPPVKQRKPSAKPAQPAPAHPDPSTSPSPAAWPGDDVKPRPASAASTTWFDDQPAPRRGVLAWLSGLAGTAAASADPDALVPLRREWAVDRGGVPMPVKLALLLLTLVTFGLLIWGAIYALLWLLIPMEE